MSWDEIKPVSRLQQVTVSCNKYGQSEAMKLILAFSGDVARDRQLKAGDPYRVYIGGSDRRGKLRLEQCDDGSFVMAHGGSGSMRLVIDCKDHVPATPREPQAVEFVRDGPGGYIINMPNWFGPDQVPSNS